MRKGKYTNLVGEMAKRQLRIGDIARDLGVQRDTVSRWISGRTPIHLEQAEEIRRRYFPEWELGKLFEE